MATVPASHTVQSLLPVLPAYVPSGHGVQLAAPASDEVPAAHASQSASSSWYSVTVLSSASDVPAGQSSHVTVPVVAANSPGPHVVHEVDASFEANVPTGQSAHDVEPADAANVPSAHAVHRSSEQRSQPSSHSQLWSRSQLVPNQPSQSKLSSQSQLSPQLAPVYVPVPDE